MSAPNGLTIKNNLNDMQIGDCIPCRYTATTSGQSGYFSELGTCVANEISISGSATPDGLFYLIKTAKGTLIADRVIQHSISWDVLNTAKYIEGKVNIFGTLNTIIRSLSGGCAYADVNGNKSLSNANSGAWPTNNDWDKYIVNSDLKGKIIKGDDNIWHWNNIASLCKETPINGMISGGNTGANTQRIFRGIYSLPNLNSNIPNTIMSNSGQTNMGFRPVLNYVESGIASEVIY